MKGYVPAQVWVGAAIVALMICGMGLYIRRRKCEALPAVAMALLLEYSALVVCTTLVFRHSSDAYSLKWPPMWSYLVTCDGGTMKHYVANGLNVLMFVPIGLLYKLALRYSRWWTMLTVAAVFSLCIEIGQLVMHRGFCEVDDLLHNCLGTLIGYGIAALISRTILINKRKGQSAVSEELPADNNK